ESESATEQDLPLTPTCPGNVGCPCETQAQCDGTPGGLYCVPEHSVCSVSCVTDVDCQHDLLGETCVAGWCGIPCVSPDNSPCKSLDPSATCGYADGREMCGFM